MTRVLFFLSCIFLGISSTHASDPSSPGSMGPSLLIGVPHPINLAWDVRSSQGFSWGGALGTLSLPVPVSGYNNVTAGISNIEVRARWHPFSGAFFLGGILGVQSLFGRTTQDIPIVTPVLSVPMDMELKTSGAFLTPHLGWIWHLGSNQNGFTFGFEAGIQLPASPKSEFTATTSDPDMSPYVNLAKMTNTYRDLETKLEDIAQKVGKTPFPYAILRFGYFF